MILRGELILTANPSSWASASTPALSEHKTILSKGSKKATSLSVRFSNVIEYVDPMGETGFDEMSLMARQASAQTSPSTPTVDSDFEVHPPSSPTSFDGDRLWTSVQVFDMHRNHARGRVQIQPPEATFAEMRRLLGFGHHEVAEIFQITPSPGDLSFAHISPMLILCHDDLYHGDDRKAVLIDLELHGETSESIVETDRYTTFLPAFVHRDLLLRIAGVAAFCTLQADRCLVWHKGELVPRQSRALLQVHHGDYFRIAAPPFENPSIPSHFAVRACQAGLGREQLIHHFHTHGPDEDSFHTAAEEEQDIATGDYLEEVLDQVEINTSINNLVALFGDEQSTLQTSFRAIPDFLATSPPEMPFELDKCSFTEEFLQAIRVREQAQEFAQDAPPVLPDIRTQPLFVQQLHEAALSSASPPQAGESFGRIESWYIDQQRHRRCHHTRIVELGPDFRTWEQQLRLEWIDHIDTNMPVEFFIVQPTPEDADPTTLSQVLLVQRADDQQRTIVLSIYDAAYDNGQAHSHAVVVPHRVDLRASIEIADFVEHCPPIAPANDCQLWYGSLLIPAHQQIIVRHGFALRLTVRRPLEIDVRALQSLPTEEQRRILSQALLDAEQFPPATTTSTDELWQPDWVNDLETAFHQVAHADLRNEGSFAFVMTWYLNGHSGTRNASPRRVRIGASINTWEQVLQEAWRDRVDPQRPLFFHFVDPRPPGSGAERFAGHILLVQQPISNYAAILLSTLYPPDVREETQHLAVYTLNRLHANSAIALSLLPTGLQDRNVIVRRGNQIFPLEGAPRVGDGDCIVVEVLLIAAHDDGQDDSSWLQTEFSKTFTQVPSFLKSASFDHQLKLDGYVEPPCLPTVSISGTDTPDTHMVYLPEGLFGMREAFSLNAATAHEEQGPVATVDTWFLSGARPYVTEQSRALELDQDTVDWEPRLRNLWRDTIDWTQPLRYYWVQPEPIVLLTRHRLGHLLIVQSIVSPLVPVHLTLLFAGRGRERFGFAAALLDNPVRVGPTRDLLQLARVCLARHCTLRFGRHTWNPQDHLEVPPGAGLEFLVGQPDEHLGDEHVVENSNIEVVTQHVEPLEPAHPPIDQQIQFIQDLYGSWLELATDGPGGMEAILKVETWYLEGGYIRHNDEQRQVVLGEDYWEWEAALQRRWRDLINPDLEVDYVVVSPAPATANNLLEVHIILHQLTRPFECPSIVTTYDNGVLRGHPYTAALYLPAAVRRDDVIRHTGKTLFCPPHKPTTVCTCWHGGIEIPDQQRFPNRNGFSFMLIVNRVLPTDFWEDRFEEEIQADSTAASSGQRAPASPAAATRERQTTGQVAHTQWLPAAQDGSQQRVDLHNSIVAFEEFDTHFILPKLDLYAVPDSHPAHPWLWNWWDFATPGDELWIYYDGSAQQIDGEPSASAAAAAFLRVGHCWYFAGATSTPLPMASDSYTAEHFASAISIKMAYDILKLHEAIGAAPPDLCFCFDSLTVGSQTAGLWHCFRHATLGAVLRNLHRLIETRFDPTIQHWHVRGHSGHPGNELVDLLAQHAHSRPTTSITNWLDGLNTQTFKANSDWFWILFDQEFLPFWHQHQLQFCKPSSEPTLQVLGGLDSENADELDPSPVQFHFRLATCNVLSLCGQRDEVEGGLRGPARQQMLLQQLMEERITIFALQETRLRRLHQSYSDDYFLFRACASEQGHFGIMVGIAKHLSFATMSAPGSQVVRKIRFKEDHLAIVHQEPRIMILRVMTDAIRFLVVAGHAPHTGQSISEIENWWNDLSGYIPKAYQDWPCVLLADANASVGHHPNSAIGDYQAGPFEEKAEAFENFVHRHQLWLPATFETCQKGPGDTWTHTGGKTRRIDYVGLPQVWSLEHCEAWVSSIMDPSITATDHAAACVDLRFSGFSASKKQAPKSRKMNELNLKGCDLQALRHCDFVPSCTDVHTHAAQLQDHLLDILQPQCQKELKRPKKTTLSEETWLVVLQKREARKHLADLNQRQRLDLLGALFHGWKDGSEVALDLRLGFNSLLSMQDKLIAKALADYKQLGRQAVSLLRRDDILFYQSLLADGADFPEPKDVKKFWAVIRRSLPRFKQRRAHPPPLQLEALEGQIVPHLQELEMGDLTHEGDLLQSCHQRQLTVMQQLEGSVVSAETLPSLTSFESSLRSTTPNRATGLDLVPSGIHHDHAPAIARFYYSLLLKIHMWCAEPLQFKGGVMCLIHKKGNLVEARNYRGILLLASIAKRIHSMMRASLMSTLSPHRAEGQLGGFEGQVVQFGFHAVTTWTHILDTKGYSTAVLYLDLASAFHHLVREFALGVSNEADFVRVLTDLQSAGHPVDAARHGHRFIGILEQYGCDERLLHLFRDIHADTWFTVSKQEIIRTKRGTRPGSPLADAVFHLAMSQIMREVRGWIVEQTAFKRILDQHDLPALTIIWAGDVAVPWVSADAVTMVPELCSLVQQVEHTFAKNGFTINFELNKTNAVISFQGKAAPAMRKEFLLIERPGVDCRLRSGREVWLHFRPTYKHLGYTYATTQSLDVELRQRIGNAAQAMATLGRPVLMNRHYPVEVRLRLFKALVATKLFYGLGTWRTPTVRQLQTLRKAYMSFLRKVLRLPHDAHFSNARVLAMAKTVDVRILLALDRLSYARKVFTIGPDFLQHLLHVDSGGSEDSWLHGLASDLRWLNSVAPGSAPFSDSFDFTAVIDFWQVRHLPWKRILKKAWTLCTTQEYMMSDLHELSATFFEILKGAGAEFDPDFAMVQDIARAETHKCACGRSFSSAQGLALHRVKAHQQYAPEHNFVCGATCPHCLRFFWSSARLQQHLAYIPRRGGGNVCFQALSARGYSTDYISAKVPSSSQGTVRMDSLPTMGPCGQFIPARQVEIAEVEEQIQDLEAELLVKVQPDDHLSQGQALCERLSRCTEIWIDRFRGGREIPAHLPDLGDWWMRLLFTFDPQFEEWTELVFLSWGSHILPDIIAHVLDGEIEFQVEQIYYDIYSVLPRTECQTRLDLARQRLRRLQEELGAPPGPHRPRRMGTANVRERRATAQRVPSSFGQHAEWLNHLRQVKWRTLPPDGATPLFGGVQGQRHFLFVHLFSGRRREGDFHACVAAWAERHNHLATILSMDTANLQMRSASWTELLACYKRGLVTATLAGTPCETFSEARHQQDPSEDPGKGQHGRLPRPLRSWERLLGLEGLTRKETAQLHVGSAFFLQGTVLIAYQVISGGYFISEHPAPPMDDSRASIWSSPWMTLLRSHPDIHLHVVPQWKFGATVPKPTGLLALRLPFFIRSLFRHADHTLVKPKAVAIGKDAEGNFRTSCHKEYPARFSAGLARAVTDQLEQDLRLGRVASPNDCPDSLYSWIREAEEAYSSIRRSACWLPDFQPELS